MPATKKMLNIVFLNRIYRAGLVCLCVLSECERYIIILLLTSFFENIFIFFIKFVFICLKKRHRNHNLLYSLSLSLLLKPLLMMSDWLISNLHAEIKTYTRMHLHFNCHPYKIALPTEPTQMTRRVHVYWKYIWVWVSAK